MVDGVVYPVVNIRAHHGVYQKGAKLKNTREPTPVPSKEGNWLMCNMLFLIPSWEGVRVGVEVILTLFVFIIVLIHQARGSHTAMGPPWRLSHSA